MNSLFSKKRTRDWIDVFGHVVFLLPFTIVMMIVSMPFFMRSYLINEQSLNAGGLPQWPAKMLIPLGFVLLFFQGDLRADQARGHHPGQARGHHDGRRPPRRGRGGGAASTRSPPPKQAANQQR